MTYYGLPRTVSEINGYICKKFPTPIVFNAPKGFLLECCNGSRARIVKKRWVDMSSRLGTVPALDTERQTADPGMQCVTM